MKSKNEKQIQQGDVLIALVSKLPAGCKRVPHDHRGAVLAEGEISGHYHGASDRGVHLMEAPDGRRFIVNESDEEVAVKHQEHHAVRIEPGAIGQIGIVQEKDWFTEMVRPVVD